MKKFLLLLISLLLLTSCNIARNKAKISSDNSESSVAAKKYYFSTDYHFMAYNPDFMGKAMNYAYQEYSGVTVPVLVLADSCFKKSKYSSPYLRLTNISAKKITQAEIFFENTKNTDNESLLVALDLLPGDSCNVNLTDSFLGDNEYRLDKINFYFQDDTMLSFSADDFSHFPELADFDLSGSGTFFLKGNEGYYYLLIKNRKEHDENAGFFRLSITKETGEETIVEKNISYSSEDNAYSYRLWDENWGIEDFCFAKNVAVEFRSPDGKTIFEEITDSEQLEKISMWVAAFCYFGCR